MEIRYSLFYYNISVIRNFVALTECNSYYLFRFISSPSKSRDNGFP